MKKVICLLSILWIIPGSLIAKEPSSKFHKDIREYLELTGALQAIDIMVEFQTQKIIRTFYKMTDPEKVTLRAQLKEVMTECDVGQLFVSEFAKKFSHREVKKLLKFHKSSLAYKARGFNPNKNEAKIFVQQCQNKPGSSYKKLEATLKKYNESQKKQNELLRRQRREEYKKQMKNK